MSATQIIPYLWQGSQPPAGPRLGQSVELLALCANEFQPPDDRFPGIHHIIRVPMDDAEPSPEEIQLAYQAAHVVSAAVSQRMVCLVTCQAGLNRSGLVCGLALKNLGMSGKEAIQVIQQRRGFIALSNRWFREVILAEPKLPGVQHGRRRYDR